MQTRLPARSARIQALAGAGLVDDAAAGRQGRGQAVLGLLAGDGDVDVHRVSQRLGGVEVLHPDRRSVAERVDGVVVGQRR